MKKNIIKIEGNYVIAIIVWFFVIFPFLYYGDNSIITIHDNLDDAFGFIQAYKLNNYFWKINTETNVLNGVSTLYVYLNYSLYYIIMNYLPSYWGYILNYTISICMSTISMNILLKHLFPSKDKTISIIQIIISLSYAILPVYPPVGYTFAVIPLYLLILDNIWKTKTIRKRYLLCFLFPFFISLFFFGIYLYLLWALAFLLYWIKQRRINFNYLLGGCAQLLGIVLCDIRNIISLFVGKESNRVLYRYTKGFFSFAKSLIVNMIEGQYHAASIHIIIIVPTVIISLAILIITKKGNFTAIKNILKMVIIIVLIYLFVAITNTYTFNTLVGKYAHSLSGFNWSRLGFANRVLWYILFAYCLILVVKTWNNRIVAQIAVGLSVVQLFVILITPTYYNDCLKNYFHQKSISRGEITYAEFFDEDLFCEIRNAINYSGQKVVAFGFHPSILMYNGFSTIDGYLSYYPLKDYYSFKKIIDPELKININDREYYEGGGIRRYIYSSELSYKPTREICTKKVDINIDIAELKEQGGDYIISRAEIGNANVMNLELQGVFSHVGSIYKIWVYRIK